MTSSPSNPPPSAAPLPLGTQEQVFAWAEALARALSWQLEWDRRARCLWFWPRPGRAVAAARAELELHVHVPWDSETLQAALRLPAAQQGLDYRNARQRLQDPAAALEVVALLEGLGEGFALDGCEMQSLQPASLRTGLQQAYEQGTCWSLWWRGELPQSARGFAREHLGDAITALCTIGELLAWSNDNAYVPADAASSDDEPPQRRAREDKSRARLEDDNERACADEAALSEEEAATNEEVASVRESNVAREHFPRPPLRSSSRALGHAARELVSLDPKRELAEGVRVQVLSGPFAGRSGTVQALDAQKELVRVLIGQLTVQLPPTEIAPLRASSRRPLLSSSHRRSSSRKT